MKNEKDLENIDLLDIKGYEHLQLFFRKNTTDESCLREVLEQKCYRSMKHGFDVESGESWLDLGGNVGAFGIYAMNNGANVVSYEPDNDCCEIMELNYKNNFNHNNFLIVNSAVSDSNLKELVFFRGRKDTDRYRTSLFANKSGEQIKLKNIHANKAFLNTKFDGIKMDIEGAEFCLIDNNLLPKSNKLVFEYHLTRDRSMENFRTRIAKLRKIYKHVLYMPSLDRPYENDTYPGFFDRIITCHK